MSTKTEVVSAVSLYPEIWTPYQGGAKGLMFNILNPNTDEVTIETAARGLSKVCRYGGHIGGPNDIYSVAQHSRYVSLLADRLQPGSGLWGLCHDLAESVVGDCVSPLKRLLRDFKPIEERWMAGFCRKLGLPLEEPAVVRVADREVYIAEETQVRRRPGVEPTELSRMVTIEGIETPDVAFTRFMARFRELAGVA